MVNLSFTAKIWNNIYVRLIVLLTLCYILFNAFALDWFDYILLIYLFHTPKIDENTLLPLAFMFGLFYDLNYQIFLGLGILLFMILNLFKVYIFQKIDMTKLYSRFLFSMGTAVIYLLLTIKFYGYPGSTYWVSFAHYFTMNIIAAAIGWTITRGYYAFSHS